jgi:branched-chain amino acid transport system substrate-binding protein
MSTTNLEGQTLGGRYQIQSLIGQGGMASVYKAFDPNLRRAVAIKIIHPHLSNNPEFFRRFEEEATAVARLRHPNIVQMYDFNHDGDLYYMVMEFVMGETLQTRLKRLNASKRRLSVKEAISFSAEICDAAYYAHQRGMIHRDIKPANIMLDVNGRAILMDFGIARMVGASQHTATGAVLGTAMYMSPEQIQGLQTDARADIYSIGIMLFEILSGKPPFEADSAMTLMMMHLNDPVPDLHDLYPDTPPELVAITNKALAKNRDERYQSALEMANALRKLPEQAQKTPAPASQPLVTSPEATFIEAAVVKDTGETIIETPASVTPAKEPSKPAVPVVKPALAQPPYQPTLVEQAVQPVQKTAAPATEAIPERMPGERKKSKIWIPILAVLLIVLLGGGGYFTYTNFFAGGGSNSPLPSPTVEAGALLPATVTYEAPVPTESHAVTYSCTDPIGCVKIGPADPMHIAYLLAVAGPNAALGTDSRNGVEIAIDDAGGKILGHMIRFDGEDGGCNVEGGQAAGNKLASDSTIVAVIGTSCSDEARTGEPLLSAAGFVTISPSNTAPDMTDPTSPNHYAGYFRTAHNDKIQGAAAADFVYNFLKLTKAATIHDNSLYADKLTELFRNEFIKLGGTITGETSVAPNETDMTSVLVDIANGNPQIIYFPVFLPTGEYIINQAKTTAGLETTKLMSADGLFSPDLVNGTGDAVEGFMVTSPILRGAEYDAFVAKYQAKFGTLPMGIFHAHAYDAFNIVKAAIEKVAIQEADGTIYIPRQALRDAMAATTGFNGLTGVLTCTVDGDCSNPVIGVYKYHAGQYPPALIWPKEYTAATPAPVIGGADKIAFLLGKNVWVANLDGTELTQLTQNNTEKNYLRWLPDGQGLTYISGKCIESVSLSGEISQITCFNNADKLEGFEVSPDGKQVVIGLDSQVYLVPFDLEGLSKAYSHDSLSAMATCANLAPYTRYSAHYARWSKDSTEWALVAQIPYNNMRADVVAVFPVDKCYPDNYAAIEVQFPPPHFTYPGYEKIPVIQDLGFDGNSLFAVHGIMRNDGFGDLHLFNMDTFTFSERVNPINGNCCYRDAEFSPDGSYLVFAYQDVNLGQAGTTRLYYIPFGSIGTGETYEPLQLPDIIDPRERPQPVLRPAIP